MNKTIAALLLTVLAAAFAAAGGDEAPAIFTKLKPKVGSWAEYSTQTMKGDKTKAKGRFRFAVVGKEGDSLWVEQKMTLETPKPRKDGAAGVMKFLMGKDGVTKAFMKSDRGVMDMSSMMGSRKKEEAADRAKMTEVGTDKIEVPAGKYKATHYTFAEGKNTGDAWMKPGVGPYGMIKQVHREGKEVSTLELLASGDDAKSEVDEKSAQSPFGAMMDRPSRAKSGKKGAAADSDEKAPEAPSFGGMFKNALKKKAGLGGD